MNDPLSVVARHPDVRDYLPGTSFKRGLRTAALALCVALPSAPLLADVASPSHSVSTSQAPIAWISGGIGDEARDEVRSISANYNVHLVFSNRHGAYLAEVPFKVSQANGKEIYSGISEGPLLYLQLPPGSYRISAEINGVWQHKQIQASRGGRIARSSFIARNE